MPPIRPDYCGKCRKQKHVDWITKLFFNDWMHLWIPCKLFHLLQTTEHRSAVDYFLLLFIHKAVSSSSEILLHHVLISMSDTPFSLCSSTAQRPLRGLSLQGVCSCSLASSCAQAEFSPTTPIMKIKTCGRGPDRYCRLKCKTIKSYTGVLQLAEGHNTINGEI